ncbi:MAG: DUF1592 domain-containing protein [Planctomycetaceae bacterium]
MKQLVPSMLILAVIGCHDPGPGAEPVADQEAVPAAGKIDDVQQIAAAVVEPPVPSAVTIHKSFQERVEPLLKKYCHRCHDADTMESGIRVDRLDGAVEDRHIRLWKGILGQVAEKAMPPEDEPQPTDQERRLLTGWIDEALIVARTRKRDKNGSIRRLTVAQYRNTLRDLLGIEDNLTDVLPPDSVSRDGFVNNEQTMLLSPLLVESYFDIAEKALDLCIVDEKTKPVIQNFRMELGKAINPKPFPDKLILGALSRLLANNDFQVSQLSPTKPFAYEPFRMRTKYRFIEGYQGNATVRGWRDYDSIYHAVFACVRGTDGYPKGRAHQAVPDGLLLRPAIPSAELFQVESTYGPKANFKISLRELPDDGRFRVTVKAARYDDGLLLDPGKSVPAASSKAAITVENLAKPQTVTITRPGIYQADVYTQAPPDTSIEPDASKLAVGLVGAWKLDGNAQSQPKRKELVGRLEGDAKFVDSPFGQAISLDGNGDAVVVSRDKSMNVGTGEFTVAAWIHPRALQQGGIVCLGRYSWTHGWYLDMPNNKGVLRIETASPANKSNGTVASRPGVIRVNTWQHVAAVVRRGTNKTQLYINGYQVASGTIAPTNLDNPAVNLYIGRIQDSKLFKGSIDEVRFYRRALDVAEIQALLEPGRRFVKPPTEKPQNLALKLGDREFSATLRQPAFLAVRLPAGPLEVTAGYGGKAVPHRIVLTPLEKTHEVASRFEAFARRSPRLGVHVGLRRDCGSTLTAVGEPRVVRSSKLQTFVFEGAIANFPSPDVEKDNVNYLAGIREIGVRSEYTDGRDMPRLLVRSVEFEGPFYETWPPTTHRRIFIESASTSDPAAYADEVIRSFATRAFRRPISDTEAATFLAIWRDAFARTGDFKQSIKDALLVVLTSPRFLFLIENSETPEPEELDPYELASKLSYFLWNAGPDEQLLKRATANSLHKSLDTEIQRMIQDRRFWQFAGEFTSQWLSLEKFDLVKMDRKRYPKLTRDTKTQLREEPARFLQHLVRHNLSLQNLIQSDFIVANEVVAGYYDLADRTESGFEFVAIKHENKNLGGLLSQAGILAGLSNGRESNPIKRGAWLARKIIAEPPDDPPPNVPRLPKDEDSKRSLREKLEQHRNQKGCAKCHRGIDPWGIPFEEFDAGGLFKQGREIDARSTLPDKTDVTDANGLKAYLVNERIDRVAFSFLKHLASYAVGRSLSYNELEFLREKSVELKPGGYPMREMIGLVVKSRMFLEK